MFDLFGYEKLKEERKQHNRNLVVISIVSAFVAAVTSLLFSPTSGKENRTFLAKQSKKAYKTAVDGTEEASKNIHKIEDELKGKFDELRQAIDTKLKNKEEPRLVEEDEKTSKK